MQIPNLREMRELQGLTQKELAGVSGVSLRSVAGYEGGARVRPNTARKLANALDVKVADLVGVDAHPKATAPPRGEERRETVYRFTGEQKVTAEQLREHGIEANDSVIHVLNQYIEIRERPPAGPVAIWHVEKEGEPVDHERVKTLLAFVLASGMLTEDATEALRGALHAELVGTSA